MVSKEVIGNMSQGVWGVIEMSGGGGGGGGGGKQNRNLSWGVSIYVLYVCNYSRLYVGMDS